MGRDSKLKLKATIHNQSNKGSRNPIGSFGEPSSQYGSFSFLLICLVFYQAD
jgi:hypothetical protein